jgi:hypothetical protein
MTRLTFIVALCVTIASSSPAFAQPGGVAEPDRGTRTMGDVKPNDAEPAPETDVGERPTRPTTPAPDDATRHDPGTHGGSMPPSQHTGPTHPPGPGGMKQKDAP